MLIAKIFPYRKFSDGMHLQYDNHEEEFTTRKKDIINLMSKPYLSSKEEMYEKSSTDKDGNPRKHFSVLGRDGLISVTTQN